MILTLDKINFEDTDLLNNIFEWRNDENTRLNSINTNLITIDIFNNIINKYKQSEILNVEPGVVLVVALTLLDATDVPLEFIDCIVIVYVVEPVKPEIVIGELLLYPIIPVFVVAL